MGGGCQVADGWLRRTTVVRVSLRMLKPATVYRFRSELKDTSLCRAELARELCRRDECRKPQGELCAASARKGLPQPTMGNSGRHCRTVGASDGEDAIGGSRTVESGPIGPGSDTVTNWVKSDPAC